MKSLFKTTLWSLFIFVASQANASMVCPPDKYLRCDDDITDLYLTGQTHFVWKSFLSHPNV